MTDETTQELPGAPGILATRWNQLAPRYLWEVIIGHVIFFAFLATGLTLAGVLRSQSFGDLWFVWPALAGFLGLLILHAWHSVPRKGYAIREHDLLFRKGLFWQSMTAVPFNRVQHVETKRGPLERQLGLSSLMFFTAGGTSGDMAIPGLEAEAAEELRDFILTRIGREDVGD